MVATGRKPLFFNLPHIDKTIMDPGLDPDPTF